MAETPALRALVIDDEPAMRALLVDVLTLLAGVETMDVALTGAEVVEALHRRDPAVKVVRLTGPRRRGTSPGCASGASRSWRSRSPSTA